MNQPPIPFDDVQVRLGILDQMLDAVIFADCEGVIRIWNRGAEVLFGFAASEALGQSLDLIVPTRLRAAHDAGFRRALASGHLQSHGEPMTTRANHKYGCRLYVDFSFGILKDAQGAVLGVFAVGRDATARHLRQVAASVQSTDAPR
jgi:PAS domain S-box-containing protein